MLVHEKQPFNAEPPAAVLAGHELTSLDTFYVRGHGPVPEIDPDSWRLQIDGLVESALELSLDDLRDGRFPEHEVIATLQCAGNRRRGLIEVKDIPGEAPWGPGATGTASWQGVSLSDVLVAAGVDPAAQHVAFVGADRSEEAEPPQRYGASIPLAKALRSEVLLAYGMNGEMLPPVHGAPVRLVVPGYIGARSVKWLERIEVRSEPWDGFFQATTYHLLAPDQEEGRAVGMPLGEVALNSAVLSPVDGAEVRAGRVEVQGYAFAGGVRSVERVDVSADGGETWVRAKLGDDLGRWAWRTWRVEVDLEPGEVEILSRAWDSAANVQPERAESLWNPKGYVNSSWGRVSVRVSGA